MNLTEFMKDKPWLIRGLGVHYSSEEALRTIEAMQGQRLGLMEAKDKQYGGSWQKDGLMGAFMNTKRKIDRILSQWESGAILEPNDTADGDTILDTIEDTIAYLELYTFLLFRHGTRTKKQFDSFVQRYPSLGEEWVFVEKEKGTDGDQGYVSPKQ
jgi:hypothetical protein